MIQNEYYITGNTTVESLVGTNYINIEIRIPGNITMCYTGYKKSDKWSNNDRTVTYDEVIRDIKQLCSGETDRVLSSLHNRTPS